MRYAKAPIFSLLMIPLMALAGEGALEINQACVADGCFAGDDPGFPVEISEPGRYVLSSNLTVAVDAAGIDAATSAEGAQIDLRGFTVSGANECSGDPVVTSCTSGNASVGVRLTGNRQRLTNGSVRGFRNAVSCAGSCVLSHLSIAHNSDRGIFNTFSGNTDGLVLRDSTIERNGGAGLAVNGAGNLVEGNTIRFNGDRGVVMSFWTGSGIAYGSGIFKSNTVSWNATASDFTAQMLITGNSFDQEDGSDPFGGGHDDGTNLCNGSPC